MIRVGVVGATGYSGVELLRLLATHPGIEFGAVTSREHDGRPVADVFQSLRGAVDLKYCAPRIETLVECEAVFFAAPNATAMKSVPALLEAGVRVVDLSADFRLKDVATWERWYGTSHVCPELLGEAVYGLPEVNRDAIARARLVANPGCYPTAIQLGFLPLLERDLVDRMHLIADAKSGVSGAGRKESMITQYCEAGDSLSAYAVAGHRHLPEIRQGLEAACGNSIGLTFVPHLTPMLRGIHATLYARLTKSDIDLQEVFEARYADEPFVDVMPANSHPETRGVRGSNVCRLSWHRPGDGDTVVVLAVEDNLGKGAAGQAVQNMNIMFGFEETTGIAQAALVP